MEKPVLFDVTEHIICECPCQDHNVPLEKPVLFDVTELNFILQYVIDTFLLEKPVLFDVTEPGVHPDDQPNHLKVGKAGFI